jgi:hypothetical protein
MEITEQELSTNLRNREWRLNNLYWIKDDQGQRIKFRLNRFQKYLLDHLWFLNTVLKARQLGITTFFCVLYLDDVVFNGLDAGLIAHTLPDAIKIFDSKIKYAWDNLPESIRTQFTVDADTARELKFAKGTRKSSIYVGTSLRSGTVQRLHISELGTIDQRYPAKSEEIKSGALNTVHKGQIVTIESTAKGQQGVFYDICKEALDNEKMDRGLTEMDYKVFFFPWYMSEEYALEGDVVIPKEMQEYFRKIEVETGIKLEKAQKNWYYKKYLIMKDSMKSEFPSTPAEAFQANIEGSYYGKQMDRVLEEGRVRFVPYEPRLPVSTFWDIGTSKARKDSTSIIFTQFVGNEIHLIDFYGNFGEGLSHYVQVLKDRGYTYGRHWGPHDLSVVEFGTGKTRVETAAELGLHFDQIPNIDLLDGIEATRMVLKKCWFDEEKTQSLIKALMGYRKEWDDKLGKFKDNPLKDWASDPADAFRMLAVGCKENRLLADDLDEEEIEIRDLKIHIDPFNPFSRI